MDQNPVNLTPDELKEQNLGNQAETQVEEKSAEPTPAATVENEDNTPATPPVETSEAPESHEAEVDTRSMSAEELLRHLGAQIDALQLPKGADLRRLQNLVEKKVREATQNLAEAAETALTPETEALQVALINLKTRYQELRAKQKEEEKNEAEANLAQKEALLNDLEALLTSPADYFTIRNERANLINRWREIGAVPENRRTALLNRFAKVNEAFYEQNKFGDEDVLADYRENRETKESLIAQAKELANDKNIRRATRKLRELQDLWKETGPVAPEFKDAMWKEFKDAASVVNKKQEEYNEEVRKQQQEALEKKKSIADDLETLLAKIPSIPREWQKLERNINRIKEQWRNAGRVAREDRWEVDSRYRVAMDEYYHQRRSYSKTIAEESVSRVERMKEILEEAIGHKSSETWHEVSQWFKEIQQEWESLRNEGIPFAVDRRLNRSFRRAADQFFGRMRDHYATLRAGREENFDKKMELVERLRSVWESKPADLDEQIATIESEWQSIGPVPDKKKDDVLGPYYSILRAYRGGGDARRKPADGKQRQRKEGGARRNEGRQHREERSAGRRQGSVAWSTDRQTASGAPVDFSKSLESMTTEQLQKERNDLKWNIKQLESQRLQYENNLGFFQSSAHNDPMVQHIQKKIDAIQKDIDRHEQRLEGLKEAIKTSSDEVPDETATTDETVAESPAPETTLDNTTEEPNVENK